MPDLNFYSNNVILTVTSSEYILKDDNYCELGISYMDSDDELIILGDILIRKYKVVYDKAS